LKEILIILNKYHKRQENHKLIEVTKDLHNQVQNHRTTRWLSRSVLCYRLGWPNVQAFRDLSRFYVTSVSRCPDDLCERAKSPGFFKYKEGKPNCQLGSWKRNFLLNDYNRIIARSNSRLGLRKILLRLLQSVSAVINTAPASQCSLTLMV